MLHPCSDQFLEEKLVIGFVLGFDLLWIAPTGRLGQIGCLRAGVSGAKGKLLTPNQSLESQLK